MKITHTEIKQIRRELGLTQAALAEQLDVTTLAVKHWEAGRRECSGPAAVLMVLLHKLANPKPVPARPKYVDLAPEDWAAAAEYDWCELKYDGHYGELVGGPDGWELRSRGGHLVDAGPEALPVCHLLVEQITGTEWAETEAPPEIRGKLVAWSALGPGGQHTSKARTLWYVDDLIAAGLNMFAPTPLADAVEDAQEMWAKYVERDGFEGLIFRTHDGRFARMKHRVTADFVCMGDDGGSLLGGVYNRRGKLIQKVRVPCLDSRRLGAVFEVSGLGITQRGSVRNPRFERWRPDKAAEECTT